MTLRNLVWLGIVAFCSLITNRTMAVPPAGSQSNPVLSAKQLLTLNPNTASGFY
jgi:hypothetical protein